VIRSINAVTLATGDMARAVRFYLALGFTMAYGGEGAEFTSFRIEGLHVNLTREAGARPAGALVRVIFYVDDVDAMHRHVLTQGLRPESVPRDAPWGERYFHVTDPDGHSLSFARPLRA
jgi:catechol 2,3-dioxygenase-like lactoylglutathione lyase family enzyme